MPNPHLEPSGGSWAHSAQNRSSDAGLGGGADRLPVPSFPPQPSFSTWFYPPHASAVCDMVGRGTHDHCHSSLSARITSLPALTSCIWRAQEGESCLRALAACLRCALWNTCPGAGPAPLSGSHLGTHWWPWLAHKALQCTHGFPGPLTSPWPTGQVPKTSGQLSVPMSPTWGRCWPFFGSSPWEHVAAPVCSPL